MKKKELTENDIKYPILSMLLDGPKELAARADALRDSLFNDLANDSHPRLRQLEIISKILEPHFVDNNQRYQYALQQVNLVDLRLLLEASGKIDDRTKLITTIGQVQRLANQISFTVDLSLEYTDSNLSWSETTSLDLHIEVEDPKHEQLEWLEYSSSPKDMIATLTETGYKVTKITVDKAYFNRGELYINDRLVLKFKSTGIDSRFMSLFFRGTESLKKRSFQLGDIIEKLDGLDYPSPNKEQIRSLQKRYSATKNRINLKVKAQTGIDELIRYEDKAFFINPDLLK